MRRLLLPLCAALACAGCLTQANRTDYAHGVIMDVDGTMRSTTDDNVRDVHENQLQRDLRAAAERDAAAITVSNAHNPEHGEDRHGIGTWTYATVALDIRVPADFPLDDDRIEAIAFEHYRRKLERPRSTAAERFTLGIDRTAPATASPAETDPAGTAGEETQAAGEKAQAASTDARRYRVQPGDTLATIAAVFYGDAQHWRRIVDANPGLDPAALPVGETIAIPADEP